MKKRVASFTLAAMMTAGIFAGCGSSKTEPAASTAPAATASATAAAPAEGPSKDTKITFFASNGDPLFNEVVKSRLETFAKKYPKVKIENITITANSYSEGLKTKDAVGEFPDLLEGRDIPMWVRAGKLAEVDKELTALVENPPLLDGKSYTVPFASANTLGFFYNAKLFKDNGWTEPKTYDEFLALCEKIKAKGVAPLVVGDKDIFHVGFLFTSYWMNYVTRENPNFIVDRYQGKVKFADKVVEDAMTKYIDLYKKGYVEKGFISTADNQIASFLVSGKAAMFYSGTHMFKQIKDADPKFDFSWFAMPDEKGKTPLLAGPQLSGWSYSVNAAKDADKLASAKLFIKYWLQKDNYVDYLQQMSAFPVTKEKMDVKYPIAGMDKVLAALTATDRKELGWNQKWGENELPPPFRNFAYKVAQEWMVGGTSIAEGLKKLDTEWDVEMKDFNPTKK